MIRGFRDPVAEALFTGGDTKAWRRFPPDLKDGAKRKLVMLAAAASLNDLRVPPGNHLEALKGSLKNRYSIRINDQWRVLFKWKDGGADDVEIVDYH